MSDIVYSRVGHCPICETGRTFSARVAWFRDHLLCSGCGSIPRERALALLLDRLRPNWRDLAIHESSPAKRGISVKMADQARNYTPTQFFPGEAFGTQVRGVRNENLEAQTFGDGVFDLVVTLDVMEHVNMPDKVFAEVARTLKPGGMYLFSVPTYKGEVKSERRARYHDDGRVEHFAEPEYHGNPVSDQGSLVTFRYGHDLPEKIHIWSGMDVEVTRFHDHHQGIIGEYTEIYAATKR